MRVIVQGYIVRGPLGGLVWHHLQYVMGLHRMGHDVFFVEDSDDYESCYDPEAGGMTKDPSYGIRFASEAFRQAGLGEKWAYFDAHRNMWLGPAAAKAPDVLRTADLLLNISGVNPVRGWFAKIPHRALIDTDPVFTQVRHLRDERKREDARAHNVFFSFGENIGRLGCMIPDDGLPWMATRQPVVLDAWPVAPGNPSGRFTTVMQWESYPPVEYEGRCFGMKSASFGPYMDLPRLTDEKLDLAVGSASAPRDQLRDNGWMVTDPVSVTRTGAAFQQFVRNSKAEFSLAKHGYVVANSGWFSERSAGYLASGRPVVTQETGFSSWLHTDGGVRAFDSPESARDAIARVSREYRAECLQARRLAEEYFESGMILRRLIDLATASPG